MAAGLTFVFGLAVVAYVALSRRLDRWLVGAPIVFTVLGLVIGLAVADTGFAPERVHSVAELTLALVLFHDAGRIQPRTFRSDGGVMARLLLLGLPLSMVAGYLLAWALFPGAGAALWLLMAAALAPTDAGLGAVTVLNPIVPVRIRRILNVESGLNDGLSTPVVLIAVAAASAAGGTESHVVLHALLEIVIGLVVGVGFGVLSGLVISFAARLGLADHELLPIAGIAVPLLTYYGAITLHGNGFVSAFVSGVAYAASLSLRDRDEEAERGVDAPAAEGRSADPLALTEEVSSLLSYAVWAMFGVSAVNLAGSLRWQSLLYALLSLTVMRMAPVALVLLGTRLRPPTVVFVGWFGPRGLASVIFALIAVESVPHTGQLDVAVGTIALTVILSVLLHGLTSGPGARAYGAWVDRVRPAAELADAVEPTRGSARVHRAAI